jgi:ABC-type nitrate/sulfonate/bicarbonate transport system permease component
MATMICFGFAGYLMNTGFSLLERRLMPWRSQAGGGAA